MVTEKGPNKFTWQEILRDRDWGDKIPTKSAIKVNHTLPQHTLKFKLTMKPSHRNYRAVGTTI
jgi:hypothetical protein